MSKPWLYFTLMTLCFSAASCLSFVGKNETSVFRAFGHFTQWVSLSIAGWYWWWQWMKALTGGAR